MTEMSPKAKSFTEEQVVKALTDKFQDKVKDAKIKPRRIVLDADRSVLLEMCKTLKESYEFEQCSCVSGVDMKTFFQVVYHISSYANKMVIQITVDIPRDTPEVDSITPLYGGANWHEREAYDMFGIIFKGHPRMERILLPQDYQFFPLRKDYEVGRRI
ncbi:MAG TPA: NADH-quinone oxidoreductase subunit C [Methanomassiliicoccales archaeon]|jgi:NADH-quinone oxidoreductase subunit C